MPSQDDFHKRGQFIPQGCLECFLVIAPLSDFFSVVSIVSG